MIFLGRRGRLHGSCIGNENGNGNGNSLTKVHRTVWAAATSLRNGRYIAPSGLLRDGVYNSTLYRAAEWEREQSIHQLCVVVVRLEVGSL